MKAILKSVFAVMIAGIIIVSCEDEVIKPVFPSKIVVPSVLFNETTISFEANMDWEISLPIENIAYFWIQDPQRGPVQKISGGAGKHVITIGVTDEPDFENDVYCPVTMVMGGETRVIAEYNLLKSVKELNVYSCKVDELGYYLFIEEGGEQSGPDFETTPTDEMSIAYHRSTGFSIPLILEAFVHYEISQQPEWLEIELAAQSEVSVGRRGYCTAILKVKDDCELPSEQALEGEIVFKVRGLNETLKTLNVSFEPVNDFLSWEGAAEISFGGDGSYAGINGDQPSYVADMYSSKGVEVFAAASFTRENLGGTFWVGSEVDFVLISDEAWDASAGVLQRHELSISMLANPGEERSADIYAIPASLAMSLAGDYQFDPAQHCLNSDYSDVKDVVKPYKIATLIQEYGGEKIILISPDSGVTVAEVEKEKYTPDSGNADERYNALADWSISETKKGLYHLTTSSKDFTISVAGAVGSFDSIRYIPAENPDDEDGVEKNVDLFEVTKNGSNYEITIKSDTAVEGALIFKTADYIPIVALWIEYTPA